MRNPALDLHTHSIFSDGTLTPTALVEAAAGREVKVLALTDHDTVSGQAEAATAAAAAGIHFVPGIELSVGYSGGTLHLLGYGIDPATPALLATVEQLRQMRITRLGAIIERLQALGVPLTEADVLRCCPAVDRVGRPHIARAMVEGGWTQNFRTAFEEYLGDQAPAYVDMPLLTEETALDAIHGAGGLAVLAHPTSLRLEDEPLAAYIERLVALGLDGLEVDTPGHANARRRWLIKLAERLTVLCTGGSDFHTPGVGRELGQGTAQSRLKLDKFAPFLARHIGTEGGSVVGVT
jgi:hypothetical protein